LNKIKITYHEAHFYPKRGDQNNKNPNYNMVDNFPWEDSRDSQDNNDLYFNYMVYYYPSWATSNQDKQNSNYNMVYQYIFYTKDFSNFVHKMTFTSL